MSILTVGSMAFDTIESPAGKAESVLGGSVNYFSVTASFFSPVQIVAVVGKDFPKAHLDWLSARNIDVSGVKIEDGKTFHWVGSYVKDLNQAETLATDLNVFEAFKPKLTPLQAEAPYAFLGNIQPQLQLDLLDQMKQPKLVGLDTMNLWITHNLSDLKKVLSRVDLLSINDGEAKLLTQQSNIFEAADVIHSLGPSIVVIKQGEYGAALFTQEGTFLTNTYPIRNVVDPTGAGDSFAGALMGYLASQEFDRDSLKREPEKAQSTLKEAVFLGCVTASFTVEDFSLHRLMRLEKKDIELRKEQLKKIVSI